MPCKWPPKPSLLPPRLVPMLHMAAPMMLVPLCIIPISRGRSPVTHAMFQVSWEHGAREGGARQGQLGCCSAGVLPGTARDTHMYSITPGHQGFKDGSI